MFDNFDTSYFSLFVTLPKVWRQVKISRSSFIFSSGRSFSYLLPQADLYAGAIFITKSTGFEGGVDFNSQEKQSRVEIQATSWFLSFKKAYKSQWNDFSTITTHYQATVLSTSPTLLCTNIVMHHGNCRSQTQIAVKWFPNHNHLLPGDGPIYVSILVLLAIACVFTIAGGLTAVIWTDFIQASSPCFHDKDGSNFDEISTFSPWYFCLQTILMIIGALVLSILAFTHEDIGGYEQLVRLFEWKQKKRKKSISFVGLVIFWEFSPRWTSSSLPQQAPEQMPLLMV